MGFKTAIPFGGSGRNEAFFVNEGIITKAELGYDVAPFPGWEGSENLVLRLELEREGLNYPVRLTAFGSYATKEEKKEVTKGRGKTKQTEEVTVTEVTGMGSAFRVTEIIREACESGQVEEEIEINDEGLFVVNGEVLAPSEPGEMVEFEALHGVKIFYVRYKADRKGGQTGYNTHRRFMTYREGEDNGEVEARVKADFIKQVREGWIKDYIGDIPDEEEDVAAATDGDEKPPF